MGSIALLILKILGILLLALFLLLLTVLLLVLFVPVRYRLDGEFNGETRGEVLVSCLLHLVTARVSYEKKAALRVKVLGFRLMEETLWEPDEDGTAEDEAQETDAALRAENVENAGKVEEAGKPKQTETAPPRPEEERGRMEEERVQTAEAGRAKAVPEKPRAEKETQTAKEARPPKEAKPPKEPKSPKEPKPPVTERVSAALQSLSGRLESAKKTVKTVWRFLNDEKNKAAFAHIWLRIRKVFKHLLPGKIAGRIHFGFDDPYTTGQALAAVSPFYGLYAKSLVLEPDFTEKVLEGELHIKGRIRAGYLLWTAARLFLDRNFRLLFKRIKRLRAGEQNQI